MNSRARAVSPPPARRGEAHPVIGIHFALADAGKTVFEQPLFERIEPIGEQDTFQVVVLVLNDARGDALELFLVRLARGVFVTQSYALGAEHLLVNTGNAQTAFMNGGQHGSRAISQR